MMLFFAFACFALLLAGWIIAPNSPTATASEPAPSGHMAETGTSPA